MRQHELKRQQEEMIREQRAVALQMQQMQQAVEEEQRARELKDKHERAKQLALAPSGPVAAAAVALIPDEKVLVVVLAQGKLSKYLSFHCYHISYYNFHIHLMFQQLLCILHLLWLLFPMFHHECILGQTLLDFLLLLPIICHHHLKF